MKKIVAIVLGIFGIGCLPLLMGPTGGYPYTPLFGWIVAGNGSNQPPPVFATVSGFQTAQVAVNDPTGPANQHTVGIANFAGAFGIVRCGDTGQGNCGTGSSDNIVSASMSGASVPTVTIGNTGASGVFSIANNNTATLLGFRVPKFASVVQASAAASCTTGSTINVSASCTWNSAGNYTFTFSPAFLGAPECVATIQNGTFTTAYVAQITAISTTSVTVAIANTSAVSANNTFALVCVGT